MFTSRTIIILLFTLLLCGCHFHREKRCKCVIISFTKINRYEFTNIYDYKYNTNCGVSIYGLQSPPLNIGDTISVIIR